MNFEKISFKDQDQSRFEIYHSKKKTFRVRKFEKNQLQNRRKNDHERPIHPMTRSNSEINRLRIGIDNS